MLMDRWAFVQLIPSGVQCDICEQPVSRVGEDRKTGQGWRYRYCQRQSYSKSVERDLCRKRTKDFIVDDKAGLSADTWNTA